MAATVGKKVKNTAGKKRPSTSKKIAKNNSKKTVPSEKRRSAEGGVLFPEKKRKKRVRKKNKAIKKRPHHRKIKKRSKQWLRDIVITLLLAGSLLYIVTTFVFPIARMEGYSMIDTLSDGDRVLVWKNKKIRRFDLVLLKNPQTKELIIRRVIGLPGEEFSFKSDVLTVDGQERVERFIMEEIQVARQGQYLFTEDLISAQISGSINGRVPSNSYFVLGDNRPYATDSRYFGMVNADEIIGKGIFRVFPFHKFTQF